MDKEKAFDLEYEETLRILLQKYGKLNEFSYFLDLFQGKKQYSRISNEPRVIMLSHSFPDEIVRALNLKPCYVFGGSYQSSKFENVSLPKDANDQAKSILGIIKSKFFNLRKDDVLLLPYSNDNYKAIESILKDEVTIIGYDVPANQNEEIFFNRFNEEIHRVTHEICKHFKKHLFKKELRKQWDFSKKAAQIWANFEKLYQENNLDLDVSGFVLLLNSYYVANSKLEWANHLEKLMNELNKSATKLKEEDKAILLMGSPIYAPNFKILFEAENLRLPIKYVYHVDSEHIKKFLKFNFKKCSLKSLIRVYSNAVNEIDSSSIIDNEQIEGVIYHIIKGEIQYAYGYQIIEKELVDTNKPIIKIETVYDYQDIEQIKIRLQAFSELIDIKS